MVLAFQDSEGTEHWTGCVADGAGSAPRGADGAAIACQSWISWAVGAVATTLDVPVDRRPEATLEAPLNAVGALAWVGQVRSEIEDHAAREGAPMRDYACTFLGAYISDDCATFIQIGDGAIVARFCSSPNEYRPVFWPMQGQFANVTTFLTDADAMAKVRFRDYSGIVEEVALFSDGLQRLALSYETKGAHSPFFDSMFSHLRPAAPTEQSALSAALAEFLGSEMVNERTDDDKTLILATKLCEPSHAPTEP